MNRTKIEWTDYTWNPITGCLHGCPYCYARKITQRFKSNFPNGFEPTFYPRRLHEPYEVKNPSKIFTVSMGDMYGEWVPFEWQYIIYSTFYQCPWHIFQILTKAPENIKNHPMPLPNVWMGISLTGGEWSNVAQHKIRDLIRHHSGLKFISFEPLLNWGCIEDLCLVDIDWIIIGAQTNPFVRPPYGAVEQIVSKAEQLKIPLFFKDSMKGVVPETIFRQEFPTEQKREVKQKCQN